MKMMGNSYMTIKVQKSRMFKNGGYGVKFWVSDDNRTIEVELKQETTNNDYQIDELIQLLQSVKSEKI